MPHADWHKKPVLATILKEAIRKESAEEVVRLNEITDDLIQQIESNEETADKYWQSLMKIKEGIEDIKKFWADTAETRKKVKSAIKVATTAKKAGETTDKASTISMSLNPVVAAVQYATKLLIELLQSEITALSDVVSVMEPTQDEFISFSGGRTSSNVVVKGTFNEKIEQLEKRLADKRAIRKVRREKLRQKRLARINNAAKNLADAGKELTENLKDSLGGTGEDPPKAELVSHQK